MDLVRLDMSGDDEAGIVLRLDHEIPALALAGAQHVLVLVAATTRQARDALGLRAM